MDNRADDAEPPHQRGKGINHHFKYEWVWMWAPFIFVLVVSLLAGWLGPYLLP